MCSRWQRLTQTLGGLGEAKDRNKTTHDVSWQHWSTWFLRALQETTVALNTFLEALINCHLLSWQRKWFCFLGFEALFIYLFIYLFIEFRKWFLTNGWFMAIVTGQISINGYAQEGNSNWDEESKNFSPAIIFRCFCFCFCFWSLL